MDSQYLEQVQRLVVSVPNLIRAKDPLLAELYHCAYALAFPDTAQYHHLEIDPSVAEEQLSTLLRTEFRDLATEMRTYLSTIRMKDLPKIINELFFIALIDAARSTSSLPSGLLESPTVMKYQERLKQETYSSILFLSLWS